MHTDNGSTFGSVTSMGRYTRLSYWLVEKGVIPVYSDPASPQQNGRQERMHKDLKAYYRTRMKTPQSVHKTSERIYPEKKTEYDYPFAHEKIKVTVSGAAR